MSTNSRTCGSSSRDLFDRAARCAERGLLNPGSLRRAPGRVSCSIGSSRSQQRLGRPGRSAGARRRAERCAIWICGRRNASRSASVRRVRVRRPVVQARADDADARRPPRPGARRTPRHPPRSPRERPPQLAGLRSISTATPSATMPTAMSAASRSPAITSGVQLKADAAERPARGEDRRSRIGRPASSITAAGACGAPSSSGRSTRNGSTSGPSGPTCRYGMRARTPPRRRGHRDELVRRGERDTVLEEPPAVVVGELAGGTRSPTSTVTPPPARRRSSRSVSSEVEGKRTDPGQARAQGETVAGRR